MRALAASRWRSRAPSSRAAPATEAGKRRRRRTCRAGVDGATDASVPEAGLAARPGRPRRAPPGDACCWCPARSRTSTTRSPPSRPSVPRVLQDALEARLEALDTLALDDGGPDPVDWPVPDGGTHPLLPMLRQRRAARRHRPAVRLARRRLRVDLPRHRAGDRPRRRRPHDVRGTHARDDVVDETMTLLVTGTDGPSRKASPARPGRPRRRSLTSPTRTDGAASGRGATPQLEAHLVEARRVPPACPAEQEERVMHLGVVGRCD